MKAGGRRRFVVDTVEFLLENGKLSYWPTRNVKTYQVAAAIGIAAVSAVFSFLIFRNRPLNDLSEAGPQWNSAAGLAFGVFAFALITAIPMYLRGAEVAFIIDSNSRTLLFGKKVVQDLSHVDKVRLQYYSGLAGEYSSVPFWSVVVSGGGKECEVSLLSFEQESDAIRVRSEVASLLGAQVV